MLDRRSEMNIAISCLHNFRKNRPSKSGTKFIELIRGIVGAMFNRGIVRGVCGARNARREGVWRVCETSVTLHGYRLYWGRKNGGLRGNMHAVVWRLRVRPLLSFMRNIQLCGSPSEAKGDRWLDFFVNDSRGRTLSLHTTSCIRILPRKPPFCLPQYRR